MQKDHLSELVSAQTRPTKLSVLASNGQATPPAFAGCPIHPLPFPGIPALGRQERAPQPGLTWREQSEQQLCLVLCRDAPSAPCLGFLPLGVPEMP